MTWFIDGSMLNPKRKLLATCGFAIAAVARDGELCAWGWGAPPKWCNSAAAAEAWALSTVLKLSVNPYRIVTDCLGLKSTAERGMDAATTAKKHLARIWAGIAEALDGNIGKLVNSNVLIWMPAHRTASDIGSALKSNGSPVTAKEWRSNRLVDGLAKLAARENEAPTATIELISSAEMLVRHSAAQLAVATYNANHHQTLKVKHDGSVVKCTTRDAQEAPKNSVGKKLLPLSTGKATRNESHNVADRQGELADDDSLSSEHLTRQQCRRSLRNTIQRPDSGRPKALNGFCSCLEAIIGRQRSMQSADRLWRGSLLIA